MLAEKKRLRENQKRVQYWKHWGPYLPERQWGTVREDYSEHGKAWDYFSYKEALYRAYRWGEDGIGGLCDTHQKLCFAFAFWNKKDPFIKERLFGLANLEGNHGEDVKEYYYFLDNTPTHSYMKYLYKYPQSRFPYEEIYEVNQKRSQREKEYELIDTKIFSHNRYFDLFIEYAKKEVNDIYIRLTICNRCHEAQALDVLPMLWGRNTWFCQSKEKKPLLSQIDETTIQACHPELGTYYLYAEKGGHLLFTENVSNEQRINGAKNRSKYTKDGINDFVTKRKIEAINPKNKGTKSAFYFKLCIEGRGEKVLYLRLTQKGKQKAPLREAKKVFAMRLKEADEFYEAFYPASMKEDYRRIGRQALAGMLWNKMHYHFIIYDWLKGDAHFSPPLPPHDPAKTKNAQWIHLYCDDILSVPDTWEFPQFFSWDTAFHTIPFATIDPEFAKEQLYLLAQEWYMHPSGQLPAYEWNFFDVNPPVHAWAVWRVFKIEKKMTGKADYLFLERLFQKLLINFTWWVNRKDVGGKNIFQGGFLGLDNISVFNRSEHLPEGGTLYQSDATSWMGMYCLNMLTMAVELAQKDSAYEDMVNKFYNHFLIISQAINFKGPYSLWDEEDGFYYDILELPNKQKIPLKVRSLVGLMPLLGVMTLDLEVLNQLKIFKYKMEWFLDNRPELCERVACMRTPGQNHRRILAIVNRDRLKKLLKVLLSEEDFLSPYGIRSMSKWHEKHPFELEVNGHRFCVDYEPGESTSRLFGGNSNWRGPIWFPINVLIIESLQKYHHYFGDDFKVEFPTGSHHFMNLWEVSLELSKRLVSLFEKDTLNKRPMFGEEKRFQTDPLFRDHLFFYEYFHGNTGKGLGASHQTGWTGFVAKLLMQLHQYGQI